MPGPGQNRHLFFELLYFLACGVWCVEVFDSHISMPVTLENLAHATTTNELHQANVVKGDAPLIHATVPALLGGGGGGGGGEGKVT